MDDQSLSVVIPTFNYAQYLPRAIESVLGQLKECDELIVVDDGSTDGTSDMVRRYGDSVGYLRQKNQGPYAACLSGLALSRGQYLVFLDADDELLPNALDAMRQAVERTPEARVVFGRYAEVSADGKTRRVSPKPKLGSQHANFKRFLERQFPFVTGAAAIHRSVFGWLSQVANAPRHGMDVVVLAHTLLHHPCKWLDVELLNVHAHPGRLRDNVASIAAVGDGLAEVLFDPRWTTGPARSMKGVFASWWRREQGRAFYRAGRYEESALAYRQAFRHSWYSSADAATLRRWAIASVAALKHRASKTTVDQKAWPRAPKANSHHREMIRRPIRFLSRCFAEHGDHVRVRYKGETFFVNDLRDISHILQTNSQNYTKERVFKPFRTVLGLGLISSSGRRHRQDRRLMQPLLHRRDVHQHAPAILESCSRTADRWQDGEQVNFSEETHRCVRDAMTRIVLGQQEAELAAQIDEAVSHGLRRVMRHEERRWEPPAWLPTKSRRKTALAMTRLNRLLLPAVNSIRRRGDGAGGIIGEFLAAAEAHGFSEVTDTMLRDHACTLLVAAGGTVPLWTSWVFYELARQPSLQAKASNEIKRAWGAGVQNADGQTPLEFIDQVIREAIRLRPAPWNIARRSVERDPLPSGFVIPADARVQISIHHLHRNPTYYPDPERFDPSRFTEENVRSRPRAAFSPFGFGPRGCAGMPLAYMMTRLVVATILSRYELRCPPNASEIETVHSPISGFPAQPITLSVRRREGAARLDSMHAA